MSALLKAIACAASLGVAPVAVQAQQMILVAGGERVALAGADLTVELTGVMDGRCPSQASCVWEGTKRVELAVAQGAGAPRTIILCNICDDGDTHMDIFGYRLTFKDLLPPVAEIVALDRSAVAVDYAVSVVVGRI